LPSWRGAAIAPRRSGAPRRAAAERTSAQQGDATRRGRRARHRAEKPVITSATNQHYQKRFVKGNNTYAKEVARYRDRLLAAHAASQPEAVWPGRSPAIRSKLRPLPRRRAAPAW